MDNIIINLDDGVTLGNGNLPNLFEQTDIISQSDAIVGPAGPAGPQGPAGRDGQAATITVGSTTTGAAGTNASVTNSGTSSAAVLNFTIPRGDRGETGATGATGETGPAGADGQAATITVGSVQTVAPEYPATVINSGTTSAAVLDFEIPRGLTGETGPAGADGQDGADGQAATITVGSTTTGAAGTNASVTNSGTSSAAVLNFTIPRGDTGATGATGSTGPQGPAGPSGADGQAATITVGSTTTGAAGTNASVTNSGTSSAAILEFIIPRGETGATGPAGADAIVKTSTDSSGRTGVYFNNGTLITYRTVTGVTSISTVVGSLYYADVPVNDYWAFAPTSEDDFISAPTVSVTVLGNAGQYMWAGTGALSPVNNNGTGNRWALPANAIRLFRATSHTAANYSINIITIGKWK